MPGGSDKTTTTSTSQATPYAKTQPAMDDILTRLQKQIPNSDLTATENNAFDTLTANAQRGNPYTGGIDSLARGLLYDGGGAKVNDPALKAGLEEYRGLLMPYANGSMIGSNPALKAQLDTMASDISGRVNSQFAAAGRDFSGMNQQTVGRGVSEGIAPVLAAQYNLDADRALGAAGSLYGAGNQTYGLLNQSNQQDLSNRQAGIEVGQAALQAQDSGANQLLTIEAQRRGIPVSNLTTLLGAISPVAQAFGSTTQTQTSETQQDPLKQIVGSAIGGLGLLGATGGFGGTGWLYGTGKGATGLLNRSAS